MIQRLRIPLACAAALGVVAALAVATGAVARPTATTRASAATSVLPTQLKLPDGFQPEGIAIGVTPFAYFGSLVDGDLFRVNLINGHGQVFSQGPGTPSSA